MQTYYHHYNFKLYTNVMIFIYDNAIVYQCNDFCLLVKMQSFIGSPSLLLSKTLRDIKRLKCANELFTFLLNYALVLKSNHCSRKIWSLI